MSEFDWSTLAGWLNASFAEHAEEIAIEYGEEKISYAEFEQKSAQIANWLQLEKRNEPYIGVYAEKIPFSYMAIAGIIRAGKAYVPLNPKFPFQRTLDHISQGGISTVICTEKNKKLAEAFAQHNKAICLLHEDVFEKEIPSFTPRIKRSDPAYLLFTSGTTGKPKGVLISHLQAVSYLENISALTMSGPGDKFSQTFELSFDLSVHDIFCSLGSGATLCIPTDNDLLSPAAYIKRHEITHWFSVPSVALIMNKLHQLKELAFPSIKSALFCGEALPHPLAMKFMDALTPEAEIYNLYGPTEATIAITAYPVTRDALQRYGNVCIGQIFEGHHFAVVNDEDDANEISGTEKSEEAEEKGELLLTGLQVIKHYFNNPEADAHAFEDEGNGIKWYKTGDLVEVDADNHIFYVGRKDSQFKINGYRVEAGEIEHVLCTETGHSKAVCFVQPGSSAQLICVLEGEKKEEYPQTAEKIRTALPAYMVPQQIVYLPVFPLNANGKTDRKALISSIQSIIS